MVHEFEFYFIQSFGYHIKKHAVSHLI